MNKPDQKLCKLCRLQYSRIQVVISDGKITKSDLVFVGEAPGEEEDECGIPFVGRCGKLLRKHIKSVLGIKLGKEVVVLNSVCCRPPSNRQPRPDEKLACRDWLKINLGIISPQIVVAVGRHAASTFIKDSKYHTERGIFFGKDYLYDCWKRYDFKVIQIYHPGFIIRNKTKNIIIVWEEQIEKINKFKRRHSCQLI
jgi:DNA polymerase